MKMGYECSEITVLWIIWDVEFDGGIHFRIWPEERLGQTRSDLKKDQNFIARTCLSFPILSPDYKKK